MTFFAIKNLIAGTEDKTILNDFNLTINEGEIHAIMGPNGTGKSTLANIICGNPKYKITKGNIIFKDKDITALSPDERAHLGIFLSFQNPIEIDGVSVVTFLKYAVNAKRKAEGKDKIDAPSFLKMIDVRAKALGISKEMLKRPLNVGFSGGEKKRIETLQMAVLEPCFCILDEMDSGLDIDALKVVSEGVNVLAAEKNKSFLLITHYDRLLTLIKPNFVHIMNEGKIVKTGSADLAKELEEKGYQGVINA